MSSFGAFGKMPGLGDFFRLELPRDFVQPWDDWMQEGMLALRDSLAEEWDECYMSAPIWRFSLPPGAAGARAVMGVVMASVDRVGRQYPLTLATTLTGAASPALHFASTTLFERLEQIALAMLEDGRTKEDLATALGHLPAPVAPGPLHLPYAGAVPPEHLLAGAGFGPSDLALWSTAMHLDHRLLTAPGLPKGRDFRALFDLSPAAWAQNETAPAL